jgi:hypothetical protein
MVGKVHARRVCTEKYVGNAGNGMGCLTSHAYLTLPLQVQGETKKYMFGTPSEKSLRDITKRSGVTDAINWGSLLQEQWVALRKNT